MPSGKKLVFAVAAPLLALVAHAMADYAPPALGIDRTASTASPGCIMSGAVCKVQIGTANLSTGGQSDASWCLYIVQTNGKIRQIAYN